jgi:hypothetical protein
VDWFIDPSTGYDSYTVSVDLQFNVAGVVNADGSPQLISTGQTVVASGCTGPVVVTAVLSPLPAGNTAPTIVWTGGSAGSDNLHRTVPCKVSSPTVTATVLGTLSATVTINVVPVTVPLSPNRVVTGVGTQFTLTAGVNAPASYSLAWSIDNAGVASLPQGNCANQTACTLAAGASGGTATVTFKVKDGSGNLMGLTTVPVTVVQITLTSIGWSGGAAIMYKTSATQPWTSDSMADEGTIPIGWSVTMDQDNKEVWSASPVWTCCNQSGAPTLSDPVVYAKGATAGLGPVTVHTNPQLIQADLDALTSGGAGLAITSDRPGFAFGSDWALNLTGPNANGDFVWQGGAPSSGPMPSGIANFAATLTFSVSWPGGGLSTLNTATQTFFVTLKGPMAFAGGSNFAAGYNYLPSGVTAQRVNYVTTNFANIGDQHSLMAKMKSYLRTGATPVFQAGSARVSDAWGALGSPAANQKIDCSSLAWIAAVLLQHAGVDSGFSFAYATSDTDARGPEFDRAPNGLPTTLDWYTSRGTVPDAEGRQVAPQAYEAYVYLCDEKGTIAEEAHTLDPVMGPISPLLVTDICPSAGVNPLVGLALGVIVKTLLDQQSSPIDPVHGGLQWWIETGGGPVPNGYQPFPLPNLGVK